MIGDLKVGNFSRKSGFFGIHFAKVRKCSAKQSVYIPMTTTIVVPRCHLSFKKKRSKKSLLFLEIQLKTLRDTYMYPPPVVRGLTTNVQQRKIHTLEIATFEIFLKTFNFESIELSPL